MENRGIIESTQKWIELRNMRNEASHGYIDEIAQLANVLTSLFEQAPALIETVGRVKQYATSVLQLPLT